MTYSQCPTSDAGFDEAAELREPFVIGSIADLKRYQDWLQKQVCKRCGAKYAERPKDKWWMTETDCGCHA